MKKIIEILFLFTMCVWLTGCRIEVNSPQSARDDNYGVGGSTQTSESSQKQFGENFNQSGIGDRVYSQLTLKKGVLILAVDFSKGQQLTVKTLDNDGTIVGSLAKKQSEYQGQQVIQVPKDGDNYIVEIQSDGSWKVQLTSTVLK